MDEAASTPEAVRCGSCGGDLEGAILMTCMHVLCRNCLPSPTARRGSVQELSYSCPVCGPETSSGKNTSQNGGVTPTVTSRIASQPCASIEELKRRSQDHSTTSDHHFENGDDADDDENEDEDDAGNGKEEDTSSPSNGMTREYTFSSPLTFPCPQHSHRDAEQFCLSCHQLACSKCLSSFHRKCSDQHLLTFAEAVTSQRPALNSLHSKLAQKVVDCQEGLRLERARLQGIDERRKALTGQIAAQREALVSALVAEEQRLIGEVNAALDREKERVEGRVERGQRSARAVEGQLSVMEAVMSVKGEPEILSLLPSLHSRLDAEAEADSTSDSNTSLHLAFHVNQRLADDISQADLGQITQADRADKGDNGGRRDENDLRLTLMTSFHARTREDTCEPLLTDLLLLSSGDVIVTDRDNKCVKKFNQSGHLLTRVLVPEVPSRLALVSHGKAAISVMTRKVLFFLSLLGTVRILSSVRVKKHYCFLAAAGQGEGGGGECRLLAATNLCDVIDIISESGVLLRRLFTHKPDPRSGGGVSISRPLYLHAPSRDPQVAALVVDSGRRLLFALTSEGQTAFTFKAKDSEGGLECPLGVATVPPSGLILLADRDGHRVMLLGRRGTFLKEVLGEKEGLHKPCALYGGQAGKVALTQVDGWLKIYKVE